MGRVHVEGEALLEQFHFDLFIFFPPDDQRDNRLKKWLLVLEELKS